MELTDSCSAKYTLRTKSILKRIESERTRHSVSKKKENKEKEKPPPLSKYRRKTANARERNRMKEINDAFISLQSSLPDIPGTDADKLTKITVLKLAVTYIGALAKVLDNNAPMVMDVEDVRQMWCEDNAHITKTDPNGKNLAKNSPARKDSSPKSPMKPLPGTNKTVQSAPRKRYSTNQRDTQKDKFLHTTLKPAGKKTSKSRSRGKVCRTNSVATNNGAYITLKNCAMQTTHNPNNRHINNQPLMMSMTVKRTRIEPIVGHRSTKMRKYEPLLSFSPPDMTHFNTVTQRLPCINITQNQQPETGSLQTVHGPTNYTYTTKSQTTPQYNILPLQQISPSKSFSFNRSINSNSLSPPLIKESYSPVPNSFQNVSSPSSSISDKSYFNPSVSNSNSHQYLSVQTSLENHQLGGLSFQDLDSPPVRNDVLLEFPRETKLSSPSDSAFSSGESAPSSPSLSLQSHTPPLGDISPFSSLTSLSGGSTSGCSISSTDCDSVFSTLLDCESFQDELDHFTSTLCEENNSFNLFMDQASSAFINCDVDA